MDVPKLRVSKKGNGGFSVLVGADGKTETQTSYGPDELSKPKIFDDPQSAYDFHREAVQIHFGTMLGHAHWNVCYHLEDVLDIKRSIDEAA